MRLNAAGAVFIALALVASAIGIIASDALAPGIARLAGDQSQMATSLLGRAAAVLE